MIMRNTKGSIQLTQANIGLGSVTCISFSKYRKVVVLNFDRKFQTKTNSYISKRFCPVTILFLGTIYS